MDDASAHEAAPNYLALSAQIAAAYVAHNALTSTELPKLVADIYGTLTSLLTAPALSQETRPRPAVPVRRSVAPEAIICLEDGKQFKSLKRHLITYHQLSPEQYRAKWGLSSDYPMVAPNYSQTRSALAKQSGLGRKAGAKRPGARRR